MAYYHTIDQIPNTPGKVKDKNLKKINVNKTLWCYLEAIRIRQ